MRVHASGVNPIDAKHRSLPEDLVYVPGHDGAGVIDAVGSGVPASRVGERVWVWAAGRQRTEGTVQEFIALPSSLALPLPDSLSFAQGASLGIPVLTAYRCLTLSGSSLSGRSVLVAGGAGAVGNAAIQLARWAGATVVATVSSSLKGELATSAGAHHVVNYRSDSAVSSIRSFFPDGADVIVEVNAVANQALDLAVLAVNGSVSFYAGTDGDELALPVRELMMANLHWNGVFLYSVPFSDNEAGVAAVSSALAEGALRPGAGLPFLTYDLADAWAAYDAVLDPAVVGKPLITIP